MAHIATEAVGFLKADQKLVSDIIHSITTDLLTLARSHEIEMTIESGATRDDLLRNLLIFSQGKRIYDQIRYLDETGQEIVRVNFNNGVPAVVPADNLQNKAGRYYFRDTIKLGKDEVFVSPFDLNIEHGNIEQPLKPTIRFGTPVFDSRGNKRGILLLNYFGVELLHVFEQIDSLDVGHLMLLNSEGYWLKSYNPVEEWGFMYEDKQELAFANIFPDAWKQILNSEFGQINFQKGLITFSTVYPILETTTFAKKTGSSITFEASKLTLERKKYFWKIVHYIPLDVIRNILQSHKNNLIWLFALLVGVIAVVSWVAANAMARRQVSLKDLKEGEEKYKQMFLDNKAIKLVIDPCGGRIVEVNQAACEFYQYSKDKLLSMRITDINTLSPDKIQEEMNAAKNQNRTHFNFPHKIATGEIRDVEVYSGPINVSGTTLLFSIVHDITERKQAEKTFQTIVQSTVGSTGQELFDNVCTQLCNTFKSECAIVGEFVGTNTVNAIAMVLDGKHIKNYSYQLPRTPCENAATTVFCHYPKDIIHLFPDAKFLQDMSAVGYVGTPLQDHSGTAIGVLCVLSKSEMTLPNAAEELMSIIAARISAEIGRMKEEREKDKLEDHLQQAQKMEAIGTLAGGIAHDFNNILGVILGYTDMAKDAAPPDSKYTNDLEKVLSAGNRAKDLVKQILAFSRQATTESIPLQPASIVKEAIKMLRPTLPTTIDINQNIDSKIGLVFADPTQLHQILMNLCTNAFHAMEETGGKLDISLKETDISTEDLVREPSVEAGTFVQLSICDSGQGIPPEIKDKIFDPYFTTKEAGKGTGMGLSIVHGIVKSYGGFISLYSEPGEGTAFHVFIPVIAKEVLPEIEAVNKVLTGKESVLFIDDEEILAEMSKVMLEKLGYHVTVRNNSLAALETFKNQPDQFDIVITDQTMPGMTGADLARKMMQIRPDIPIILCTGYSTIISEEKAKSMGIKEFALKPLTKKDLSVLIRKILDNT